MRKLTDRAQQVERALGLLRVGLRSMLVAMKTLARLDVMAKLDTLFLAPSRPGVRLDQATSPREGLRVRPRTAKRGAPKPRKITDPFFNVFRAQDFQTPPTVCKTVAGPPTVSVPALKPAVPGARGWRYGWCGGPGRKTPGSLERRHCPFHPAAEKLVRRDMHHGRTKYVCVEPGCPFKVVVEKGRKAPWAQTAPSGRGK